MHNYNCHSNGFGNYVTIWHQTGYYKKTHAGTHHFMFPDFHCVDISLPLCLDWIGREYFVVFLPKKRHSKCRGTIYMVQEYLSVVPPLATNATSKSELD